MTPGGGIYQRDLALVHHRGFGFHAEACAPGIVAFLAPVRDAGGLVLELGCGTGLLTRELVASGHRVIASDAAPQMLEIARDVVGNSAEDVRLIALPDDPLPSADAIVGVGHALNYLSDAAAVDRALIAIAGALRPGGIFAIDMCDLEWGRARRGTSHFANVGEDWAIITKFSTPTPEEFIRDITTFLPNSDGSWRRGSEHHRNVLIDTSRVPALLSKHGVEATVAAAFGSETLPPGLVVITGRKTVPAG
jgi:SAM-dependent methyltransferase